MEDNRRSTRQRPARTPREEMHPAKREALERLEAADAERTAERTATGGDAEER